LDGDMHAPVLQQSTWRPGGEGAGSSVASLKWSLVWNFVNPPEVRSHLSNSGSNGPDRITAPPTQWSATAFNYSIWQLLIKRNDVCEVCCFGNGMIFFIE
jgi:hypothetical protein